MKQRSRTKRNQPTTRRRRMRTTPFPASLDQVLYNSATLSLLKALTLKMPRVQSQWIGRRHPFVSRFGVDKFTAVADGCLRVKQTDKIQATLECNFSQRDDATPTVQMQETATIAG
jgi:hypothetical protein